MNEDFNFKNKSIYMEGGSFKESVSDSGDKKFYYTTPIVPFNTISRNGVLYNEKSVRAKGQSLVDKNLFYNHITSGNSSASLPRGEWREIWFDKDFMYGKAEIFNKDYNKDFIDYLSVAKNPRTSLQVTGAATNKKGNNGKYYKEAKINEFLEASVVSIPGFDLATGSMEVALAEAFDSQSFEERDGDGTGPNGEGPKTGKGDGDCEDLEESITPGKYKTKGGETITVHKVSNGKATISGDDSKEKELDLDALKAIIIKEDLQESAMKDVQDFIDELSNKGTSEKDIIKAVIKKYRLKKDEVDNLMDENKEFFEKLITIRTLNP